MTTGTTFLEEQVALHAKSVEALTMSLKEKDDHIAFLMVNLVEKKKSTVEERDPTHGEEVAGNQRPPVAEPKRIKDAHKGGKVSEDGGSKQSMAVDAKPLKVSNKKAQDVKSSTS
ncbi:hypothetical protein COLO4_06558 [Corchorus olitorius]|uniref:Uncharacterized protein n=1 Tax=Corchorus olitorius TaxID=93759 RepID=A0A1R3KMN5_9ROSI|nr:hypothetical protein COLO4_06558 [Corchorus olitorius]